MDGFEFFVEEIDDGLGVVGGGGREDVDGEEFAHSL
jgi:hypothetical protein